PLALGADLVLYSTTKYLGGHSDIVGGAAVGREGLIEKVRSKLTLYGATLDAHSAWLLARSLRTLELRVTRHSDNALKVAKFLEGHPKVEKVFYPGLESSPDHERARAQFQNGLYGGMLSFNLRGGEAEASVHHPRPGGQHLEHHPGGSGTGRHRACAHILGMGRHPGEAGSHREAHRRCPWL
ncbi:MAG: PLP-dependent transferase, partial [Clostridia bacterium]|nr:PLP-dependent transferase [Clostridia bacterium]